jgi:hypothetical protein
MQNKKGVASIFVLSLLFVSFFTISIASAGWFSDTWAKITGNAVSNILYPSCGPASGVASSIFPTTNLCSKGFIANRSGQGDGKWWWGCVGQNTGWPEDTAWCFAPVTSTSVCTSFIYSNWTTCNSSGLQSRTITSSSPSGCTGGNFSLVRSCTPTDGGEMPWEIPGPPEGIPSSPPLITPIYPGELPFPENNTTAQNSLKSCSDVVSFMKNPSDLDIEGNKWFLSHNDSSERYGYAFWSSYKKYGDDYNYQGSEHDYISLTLEKFENRQELERRLEDSLRYNLCSQRRIYLDYNTEEYQTVYICKNIYDLAFNNQQISNPNNPGNNNENGIVFWFNDNLLFQASFNSNSYWPCQNQEECLKMDTELARIRQNDLIRTFDKLLNNNGQYVPVGNLNWKSEQLIKHLLKVCESNIQEKESENSWNCKIEPLICPPHGQQVQKCGRYNSELNKNEIKEVTISCNPGICSGCTVPRWFGDNWASKCIEYGFRFQQQNGWIYEIFAETHELDENRNWSNDFNILSITESQVVIQTAWNNVSYTLSEGQTTGLDLTNFDGEMMPNSDYFMTIDEILYSNQDDVLSKVIVTFNIDSNNQVPSTINAYCDIDGHVKQQKTQAWGSCQNNFECESNLCSYGECVDLKGIADQVTGFKGFVVKMLCKLGNIFNEADYVQCVANNA